MTSDELKTKIKQRLFREQSSLRELEQKRRDIEMSIARTQSAIIAYENAIDDIPNFPPIEKSV